MRISEKKIESFRQRFAEGMVAACTAMGLAPGDYTYKADVAAGVLTVIADWENTCGYQASVRVGSMQTRLVAGLLATLKEATETAFAEQMKQWEEAA